ncbi:unnamed protein product, partial [Protopolystoma xenopodis]
ATTKREKYERIHEKKVSTSIEALCRGYPHEFATFLTTVRTLNFDESPNYAQLRVRFRSLFRALSFVFDYVYDWTLLRQKASGIQQQPTHSDIGPDVANAVIPSAGGACVTTLETLPNAVRSKMSVDPPCGQPNGSKD